MDLGIKGRWALVCGASKGLGFGCAQALVREGVHVIIVARGAEVLQAAAAQLLADAARPAGTEVLQVAADITSTEGRAAVFTWIKAVDANMLTPIELIKATVDGMAARGFGRIVNITSSAVKAPIDILGLSNGARSGLTGFVAGVSRSKLAGQGVTINSLLPGAFDTDRLRGTMAGAAQKTGQSIDAVAEARRKSIPAQRFGTAEEFGAICAFLCSTHAAYMTGQNVLADGGAYPGTY